jgi:NADPH-dependent 2,4-dienoyl-CoA reductase/sulfur reductase-like enzyme
MGAGDREVLMSRKRYLVVGGGMTGHAAAQAIREADPEGQVTILSADPERPYARPPLSKGLWLGKAEDTAWLPELPGVELLTGRVAVGLDPAARQVRDERGGVHGYDRLLLATGGEPRRLPVGGDKVIYFRTLADFRRLRAVAGKEVVVVGGGFIGSELASALCQNGKIVTMVFPEPMIGARNYPTDLAAAVTRTFREKGVRLRTGVGVSGVDEAGGRLKVLTTDGEELGADAVVAGLGIEPATALAEAAGLRCGDGIEVDDRLRTSAPEIFAAGDVARFPSRALEQRVRVEHEDAALTMGRTAGRNMAGADEPYDHLPSFYSDLFDLGYEAVGRLDARLDTVSSWKTPFREGVVYYLDHGRVRGVLLWGIFGQVEAARRMVSTTATTRREALRDAIHP